MNKNIYKPNKIIIFWLYITLYKYIKIFSQEFVKYGFLLYFKYYLLYKVLQKKGKNGENKGRKKAHKIFKALSNGHIRIARSVLVLFSRAHIACTGVNYSRQTDYLIYFFYFYYSCYLILSSRMNYEKLGHTRFVALITRQ